MWKKYLSFVLIIFQTSDVRTGVCAYMDATSPGIIILQDIDK